MLNITKPTLLLDEKKCRNNIKRMSEKFRANNITFRPHFKTHQSLQIAKWYKKEGVKAITVSSVSMASYFANDGWMDITIAFPVNLLEVDEINRLAKLVNLGILISDPQIISQLINLLDSNVIVWIEVDTGYHRSGFPVENTKLIKRTIDNLQSADHIQLKGFLSHTGNTYHASSPEEIKQLIRDSVFKLNKLRDQLSKSFPNLLVSLGDTPSFSILNKFSRIDEGRPGNFVFYDIMQYQLGACSIEEIAVALACPIVAKYPERGEIVIYGGAVHFSKEFLEENENLKNFGRVVRLDQAGWHDTGNENYLSGISQEHGIVKLNKQMMEEVAVGDLIGILPIHSCLTASTMKSFLTLDGKTIDHMEGV